MPPHGRGYTRRSGDGEGDSARPPVGQARWPPQASEERPPRGAEAGMAGCLRAPAARKATVQRDSHWGGPLNPRRGRDAPGHLSMEVGRGGRPGGRGRPGWRGRPRAAPDFFSDLVVLDVFLTCSGGRGEAPARGTACHALYLQGVTVGMAL